MKIIDFVSKLFPNLKKRDVMEEINISISNINEFTLPTYTSYAKEMSNWNFATRESQALISTFNSLVKSRKGNIIATVKHALEEASKCGTELNKVIERKFQDNIAANGLTYNEAQVLHFSSSLAFLDRFARRLLTYLVVVESGKFDNGNTMSNVLTPAHKAYITSHFTAFCILVNAFSKSHVEVMKQLKEIPELEIIKENDEAVTQLKGKQALDPFNMNFVASNIWPPYFFGMRSAQNEVKRYDEAREESNMLELRLIHLRNVKRGSPNPQIEQEIQYNEDRLSRLQSEIKEFEEEYLS